MPCCTIFILHDDITDWVPVSAAYDKETGEKMLVTKYEGSVIEDTGLIKMDFLGLKTLSIIKEAVANVRPVSYTHLFASPLLKGTEVKFEVGQ